MVRLRVPHLTHYELNVAGRTDFARHRRDELPSVDQNLEMYREPLSFLHANGYRQVTSCDWERVEAGASGAHGYETLSRAVFRRDPDGRISGYDVWGWGFAGLTAWYGYPRIPAGSSRTPRAIDDYYRQLDEGRFPVVRGFRYSEPDLRVYTLFQMLQELSVDRSLYAQLFGIDPLDEHAPVWEALVERGWIVVEPRAAVGRRRRRVLHAPHPGTRRGGPARGDAAGPAGGPAGQPGGGMPRRWRHDARGHGQAHDEPAPTGVRADAGPRHAPSVTASSPRTASSSR